VYDLTLGLRIIKKKKKKKKKVRVMKLGVSGYGFAV